MRVIIHDGSRASLGADLPVRRAGMVGTSFYEPLPVGLSDLIEDSAVIEMRFLGLLPVANNLSEGEELHVREPVCVFREHLFVLRAKIAFGGNFLTFGGVEILEVSPGHRFGAVFPRVLIYQTD